MPAPNKYKDIAAFLTQLKELGVAQFAYKDEWQVAFEGAPNMEDDDMSQDPQIGFQGDRSCDDDGCDC